MRPVLIYKQLQTELNKGLAKTESPIGKELDTNFHEAITNIPAPKLDKGKIVDVIEKGYLLDMYYTMQK